MRVRFLGVVAGAASLGVWSPACVEPMHIGGTCDVTEDCRTDINWNGGTECIGGTCLCPDRHEAVCCPDGSFDCEKAESWCRPRSICEAPRVIVLAAPGAACTVDEECRGPIDPRCGAARCEEGKCRFEIEAGEMIKSQYPGDCQLNQCNYDGDVVQVEAPSDIPRDSNPCTWDFCEATEAINPALSDGSPCISQDGVCVLGKCRDCSVVLKQASCPGFWLCDWDTCVPASCTDGVLSGGETSADCGGPFCRPCDVNLQCFEHRDCLSSFCQGGLCQTATHFDGQVNGDETGVDCGYPDGPSYMCKDGEACKSEFACMSGVCWFGKCQPPTCTDDRQNGDEEDTDCGGTCPPCPPK